MKAQPIINTFYLRQLSAPTTLEQGPCRKLAQDTLTMPWSTDPKDSFQSSSEYVESDGCSESDGLADDVESNEDMETLMAETTPAPTAATPRNLGGQQDPNTARPAGDVVPALYDGNLYPPTYYQQKVKDCNEVRFLKKKYALKTTKSLEKVLSIWKSRWMHACANAPIPHPS